MDKIYCYEGTDVLKNKLDIRDEETLDLIEAEQSRAAMMLMYNKGFDDFSPNGFYHIHYELFKDIYNWAGKPRVINIIKRESILCGQSVWYSNDENIEADLQKAFEALNNIEWKSLGREKFIKSLVPKIAAVWKVHPFREGNTRTTVMLLTMFIEHHGYFVDKELLAASAGYVRNSLVLASFDENSEYEHLEKILLDAVTDEPIEYSDYSISDETNNKYKKYQSENYEPQKHEVMPKDYKHQK